MNKSAVVLGAVEPRGGFRPHIIFEFVAIWCAAFLFNGLWEMTHSVLYVHYQGEVLTEFILMRAALFDAGFIAILAGLARFIIGYRAVWREVGLVATGGLVFAVGLEWWALATGRWAYNELMPLVPILNVGWSPVVQLAVTGAAAVIFARFIRSLCPACRDK